MRHLSLTRVLLALALLALLVPLGVLSHRKSVRRSCNQVAWGEVLGTGKALQALETTTPFDLTVAGPAPIPGLPGRRVSDGVTLFLRRWHGGETYVRGAHHEGTATYYFRNGTVYVANRADGR